MHHSKFIKKIEKMGFIDIMFLKEKEYLRDMIINSIMSDDLIKQNQKELLLDILKESGLNYDVYIKKDFKCYKVIIIPIQDTEEQMYIYMKLDKQNGNFNISELHWSFRNQDINGSARKKFLHLIKFEKHQNTSHDYSPNYDSGYHGKYRGRDNGGHAERYSREMLE